MLVESKPGAGGALAVNELMRADPDGYTLLMTTSSHATLPVLGEAALASEQRLHADRQHLFHHVRHRHQQGEHVAVPQLDRVPDLRPGQSGQDQLGLVGHRRPAASGRRRNSPRSPASTWSTCPIAATAPMLQALLQNDVQLTFDTPTLSTPHIQDGKLDRARRDRRAAGWPNCPNVPTVRETGLVDFSNQDTDFRARPQGHPEPVQACLNKEFAHGARRQGGPRAAGRTRARGDRRAATTPSPISRSTSTTSPRPTAS